MRATAFVIGSAICLFSLTHEARASGAIDAIRAVSQGGMAIISHRGVTGVRALKPAQCMDGFFSSRNPLLVLGDTINGTMDPIPWAARDGASTTEITRDLTEVARVTGLRQSALVNGEMLIGNPPPRPFIASQWGALDNPDTRKWDRTVPPGEVEANGLAFHVTHADGDSTQRLRDAFNLVRVSGRAHFFYTPRGARFTIKPGESFAEVAKRYNTMPGTRFVKPTLFSRTPK